MFESIHIFEEYEVTPFSHDEECILFFEPYIRDKASECMC